MSGIAIRVAGIEVEAAGRRLLGPVDLEVAEGDYVCVLGPSGVGKSTLLRSIAGLVVPQRGEIWLGDVVASSNGRLRIRPEKRGVGMLFQEGALWPHMSAERTLLFALACSGVRRSERAGRVEELLRQVHLTGMEKRTPGTLSGGERQRLALARALAPNPRILLLDEPLGPLDEGLRGALCDSLGELHRNLGFTAVHVTHDASEVVGLATSTYTLAGLGHQAAGFRQKRA